MNLFEITYSNIIWIIALVVFIYGTITYITGYIYVNKMINSILKDEEFKIKNEDAHLNFKKYKNMVVGIVTANYSKNMLKNIIMLLYFKDLHEKNKKEILKYLNNE